MTTIAAFRDAYGSTTIAADLAYTGRFGMRGPEKVRQKGELYVGIAGSLYAMGFLAENREYPATPDGVRRLARELRIYLLEAGHHQVEERDNLTPATALVVGPGLHNPWLCDCDGGVLELEDGYGAVGSGASIAMGALCIERQRGGMEGRNIAHTVARLAVEAACLHDPWTGGPVCSWTVKQIRS